MNSKILGILQLAAVIAFIGFAFFISSSLQSKKSVPETNRSGVSTVYVNTIETALIDYPITIKTNGVIQARTIINIVPEVSGRVVNASPALSAGGEFTKDSLLFSIDPESYRLAVKTFSAEVAQARTNLKLEQARSTLALKDWKDLNGDKPIPSLVARTPQLQSARAALASSIARLDTAKLNLDKANYQLPFNGRVMESTIDTGQFVNAGQIYGQVFDISGLQVKTSVDDQQMKWLTRSTPKISIKTRFKGESQTFSGTLLQRPAELDPATRFATLYIGFSSPPNDLLPGLFSDVTIEGPTLRRVTRLPTEALQTGEFIWAIDAEQTIYKVEPRIVYSTDEWIVVDNIDENTLIVTNRLVNAVEGMSVQQASNQTSMSTHE